jgi:hypothetical protein
MGHETYLPLAGKALYTDDQNVTKILQPFSTKSKLCVLDLNMKNKMWKDASFRISRKVPSQLLRSQFRAFLNVC